MSGDRIDFLAGRIVALCKSLGADPLDAALACLNVAAGCRMARAIAAGRAAGLAPADFDSARATCLAAASAAGRAIDDSLDAPEKGPGPR